MILLTARCRGMLVFFARSGARHPILPVALGLVIGGSTSNLLDRVRLGYVTDFLDLRYWPAFNLADSFIVIGVLVLLAALVLAEREPRRRGPVTRLRVPDEAAGERLDRFLVGAARDRLARGSRASAERRRRARRRPLAPKSHKLGGGEELEFEPPARGRARSSRRRWISSIPYEDEHLLVVDKPAGLVVHPAPGHAEGRSCTVCSPTTSRGRRARAARASCTGSTATRRVCSSSPARRRRTGGCRRSCRHAP